MEKVWKTKPQGSPEVVNRLSETLSVDTITADLLVQRGITTFEQAKKFFRPELDDLHDPFAMKDMDKAVERLQSAIDKGEKILIYGDYDVDGTTAVSLVFDFLMQFYQHLDYYIPDRYQEGYGVSYKGIDYAAENQMSLIIALDCGIKAIEKVEYAREKGIDFIICDHHTPGSMIPAAIAVLDPKRQDCPYPYKELSGCGVGFKLMQAFCLRAAKPFRLLQSYLDLVAVSIASDIVPITGENRVLMFYGLRQLNENPRTGLKSIIKIAGIAGKQIIVSDCVFKIGPRINAAGRIESGRRAVALLISKSEEEALRLGEEINEFNTTRKDLDQQITLEGIEIIESSETQKKRNTTVLFKNDWHKGVIGIVASRLIENYYRPTVILTESNGLATGSARSVEGFNLYDAIEPCSDLLLGFGGHRYAAGLTMKIENIEEFSRRFEETVAATISAEQLTPFIEVDAEINFADITPKFYRILKQFAPFGPENMRPVFVTRNVCDTGGSRPVGSGQEHLKLELRHEATVLSGIAFSQAEFYQRIKAGQPFDVCYSIDENEYKGNVSLQLSVRDLKTKPPQD